MGGRSRGTNLPLTRDRYTVSGTPALGIFQQRIRVAIQVRKNGRIVRGFRFAASTEIGKLRFLPYDLYFSTTSVLFFCLLYVYVKKPFRGKALTISGHIDLIIQAGRAFAINLEVIEGRSRIKDEGSVRLDRKFSPGDWIAVVIFHRKTAGIQEHALDLLPDLGFVVGHRCHRKDDVLLFLIADKFFQIILDRIRKTGSLAFGLNAVGLVADRLDIAVAPDLTSAPGTRLIPRNRHPEDRVFLEPRGGSGTFEINA